MSRKNPEGHKDLLKRAFQREDAGGVSRYVYYHDDKYYFVLAACTRLDLDFEAKSDRLIVPADVFEHVVLENHGVGAQHLQAFAPDRLDPDEMARHEDGHADAALSFAEPAVSPAAVDAPFADDDSYEEEEFVFSDASIPEEDAAEDAVEDAADAEQDAFFAVPAQGPAFLDEADAEEDEETVLKPYSAAADAPVFKTHHFIMESEEPAVTQEIAAAAADDNEDDDGFVFATPEEDEPAELRWDDETVVAWDAPVPEEPAEEAFPSAVAAEVSEDADEVHFELMPDADHADAEAEQPEALPEEAAFIPVAAAAAEEDAEDDVEEHVEDTAEAAEPLAEAVSPAAMPGPQRSMAEVQEHAVSKRTEGVHAREQALFERERAAGDREKSIVLREDTIAERRKEMGRRERRVERRRKDLEALERKLQARKAYLDSQRDLLNKLRTDVDEMMQG